MYMCIWDTFTYTPKYFKVNLGIRL